MFAITPFSLTLLKLSLPIMGKRQTNQLSLRLQPELLEQFEAAADKAGFDEQELVKAMIRSFVRQIGAGDKIEFPFRLATYDGAQKKSELEALEDKEVGSRSISFLPEGPVLLAAEEPGEPVERATKPVKYTGSRKRSVKPAAPKSDGEFQKS